MGKKGTYFWTDFFAALPLTALCILLIMAHTSHTLNEAALAQRETELTMKGVFLLDSAIKNRNEQLPALGLAAYDADKKRVEQNTVDYGLLIQTGKNSPINGLHIKSIAVEYKGGPEKKIFEHASQSDCIALERFVIIKSPAEKKKGKIIMAVCDES